MEVLAHFGCASPRKGAELALRLDHRWPGKAIPLMRHGGPDEFTTLMGRPLAYFSYRIVLPAGTQVRSVPTGLRKGVDSFTHLSTTDRLSIVHLEARDIAADHRIGLRPHLVKQP